MARYVHHSPAQPAALRRTCAWAISSSEATLKGSQFLKGIFGFSILRYIRSTLAGYRGAIAVKICLSGLAVVCVAVLAARAQSGIHAVAQNTVMSPYQGEQDGV